MISHKRRNTDPDHRHRRSRNKQSKVSNEEEEENVTNEVDDAERELESFLFGGGFSEDVLDDDDVGKVVLNERYDEEKKEETELLSFEINTTPSGGVDFYIDNGGDTTNNEVVPIQLGIAKAKPAWVDPDDEDVTVDVKNEKSLRKLRVDHDETDVSGLTFQQRLKTNFEKVLPAPAWADITNTDVGKECDDDDDDDEEEKVFKTRKKLLTTPDRLPRGIIAIKKLKDLNRVTTSSSTITSVKFHPTSKLALTASLNKNLNIYQVDGKNNEKLQSIFLTHFPIWSAQFTPNGEKIICSSRRKHFYIYDMIGGSVVRIPGIRGREEKSLETFTLSPDGELIAFIGDSGYVNLVSAKTCHWIASLKMNGKVTTSMFSPDSSKLYTAGRDGEVYVWDVNSRRCLHRFLDDGSLLSTSMGMAPNGKYVAIGSSSGVVNVYDDEKCCAEKSPTPLKALMNLTTRIGGVSFNPTSEVIACWSAQARNALKLVHLPSMTTFSNWPIEKQTLGNIRCVDFSPKGGYLGIGNEAGKALLFRLSHFPDS